MSPLERDLAETTIRDLIRSCWVVESSRRDVYRMWAKDDPSFEKSAARSEARAGLVEEVLQEQGRKPDHAHVEAHTRWITSLIGEEAGAVPLGPMFLARLGDWVEGHGSGFFGHRADEMKRLGEEERSEIRFPESLPAPPPFEPLVTPPVAPPGKVKLRFGILGDMHIGSPSGEAMVRAAIDDLNRSGAELVVQLGDITDHGALEEFHVAADVLAGLEMPWATMMGNHDVLSTRESLLSGRERFAETFGRAPDGVLIEQAGVKFAVLDSVEHAASPFPPFNLVTGAFLEGPGGAIVCGAFSHPQHELLAEVAGPGGGPAFVFLHHPPQPFTGFPPIVFGLRDEDSGRLHAVVDSGNVWGVFAGHTHRNKRSNTYDPVPIVEVGIPRDYPFGYALVDVTDEGYAYRFVQLSDEDLLREAHKNASAIHHRYGRGEDDERAFVWRR